MEIDFIKFLGDSSNFSKLLNFSLVEFVIKGPPSLLEVFLVGFLVTDFYAIKYYYISIG